MSIDLHSIIIVPEALENTSWPAPAYTHAQANRSKMQQPPHVSIIILLLLYRNRQSLFCANVVVHCAHAHIVKQY